ncbi:MAG TPA: tetratricopeptide repeat protein, partial [Thermoanaerobaculia bacterium]|nr:tetratricopeptide repeat protein [Thermoanaerobaculia bacterium]
MPQTRAADLQLHNPFTIMSHYTEDELSTYALRPDAIDDREGVEQHVAACGDCRSTLEVIEAFDIALHDPLPWAMAESMPVRRDAPPALLDHARAIAAADAHARELVLPLVDSAIRFRAARIDDDPRFYTLAVIRLLCKVANGMHERQPQFGLVLADTALNIIDKLPANLQARSAWYVATAWKERAIALRCVGRFKDAEEALNRAESAFDSDDHVEPFDLAIAEYVRATVYSEMERFDEAAHLARHAACTFAQYGDKQRYLSARVAEAGSFYCADRYAEAVPIFETVVAEARAAKEMWMIAVALANAASCYTRLGRFEKAFAYYADALAVVTNLDVPAERARILWALAALKVESGQYEEGLQELEQAHMQLVSFGLMNDAALAKLDLIAALIAVGDVVRVPDLCRSVAAT